MLDFVGYGSVTEFEGAGPVAATAHTTSALRKEAGCTDTNQDAADFTVATPAPRNSFSPVNVCAP